VARLYGVLSADERRQVIEAIGLKHCQRIGHRHKIAALRTLADLDAGWSTVDAWLVDDAAPGGTLAFGDLFGPLSVELVDRARELLGEHSDDPGVEDLEAMATALAAERSEVLARLLLAVVVDFEFTAAPDVLTVAAADPRFSLPTE
jgi:hypothetical protein